jgi:hypothetical protein
MSHDPEIERALAELAELSRRVADLAATVSALAARREGSSSSDAVFGGPTSNTSPPVNPAHPPAAVTGSPHWIPWQPTLGAVRPPQPIAFQPIFLAPSQAAAMLLQSQDLAHATGTSPPVAGTAPSPSSPDRPGQADDDVPPALGQPDGLPDVRVVPRGMPHATPQALGTGAAIPFKEPSAAAEATPGSVPLPTPKESPDRSPNKPRSSGRKATNRRQLRRPKPAARPTPTGWRRLLAQGQKRINKTSSGGHLPSAPLPRPHASGRRQLGPLSVSVVLHTVALVALATVFIVREAEPEPMVITSSVTAEEPAELVTELEMEPVELTEPVTEVTDPVLPELTELAMEPAIDQAALTAELTTPAAESLLDDTLVSGPSTADLFAPLGGGANGSGGRTGSDGTGGGGASMFFGKAGSGKSVCFMCDNSRSYEDGGFEMVVAELMRAVASLQPSQTFFVVFFSDEAYPMFYPDEITELLPATPENKQKLQAWLANVETRTGGRGIGRATDIATSLAADTIYFLSDGDYSPGTVERLISSDFGGAVVHTFGMQAAPRRTPTPEQMQDQLSHNQNLIRVAESHGGSFTPVITPPQAAPAARMRAAPGP